MKRWMVWFLLILCCASAYAEQADMNPIYEFAKDYGADGVVQDIYESALAGETSAWEAILDWAKDALLLPLEEVALTASGLIAPVFLLALLQGSFPSASGGSAGVRFLLRMILMLGFSDLALLALSSADTCIRSAKRFTDAASPGITALLAAMGMTGTSSLVTPAASLAGGIAEDVFIKYGLPLCRVALCLTIAGNLSDSIDFSRIISLLKKASNWGAGLVTTLFTALVGMQSGASELLDSAGVRTAKFAVDSAASVVGSGISDAWDSLISGMLVTKHALGMSGIGALLASGLHPLVYCTAAMLLLNLIAALLELFGEKDTSRAAVQMSGICQMALSLATGALVIATVLLGAAMAAGRGFVT